MGKRYSGIIVPLITPFNQKGEVDFKSLEGLILRCITGGVDILLFGTTGEGPSISKSVKIEIVKYIVSRFRGRVKIFAAIIEDSFQEGIHLANTYFDYGVEGVFVTLPHYYPLSDGDIIEFYKNFADHVGGDVFIYNIPQTTRSTITIDVVKLLSKHKRIVGIKDSERDINRLKTLLDLCKDCIDFSFFVGWGSQCFYSLINGADGIVPSTGNFSIGIYREMLESVKSGDVEKGKEMQKLSDKISEIYQKNRSLGESIVALKVMMNEIGLCEPFVLPPLRNLPKEEELKIRRAVSEIIQKHNLKLD